MTIDEASRRALLKVSGAMSSFRAGSPQRLPFALAAGPSAAAKTAVALDVRRRVPRDPRRRHRHGLFRQGRSRHRR